jgi:DNA-binding transcriptional LysR family regulator
VTNFEAALRVVRAGLAVSVVPREVAQPVVDTYGLELLPLDEPWARRRFIVCFRDADALTPAAHRLMEHLAATSPDTDKDTHDIE